MMGSLRLKRLPIAVLAILLGCNAPKTDTAAPADLILPSDPRFNTFELPNSREVGTVMLSFVTEDSRYCRAARFTADRNIVLACRNERGWQIEAISDLAPGGPSQTIGGSTGQAMQAINVAVFALNPEPDLLDEREVLEAADNGWR